MKEPWFFRKVWDFSAHVLCLTTGRLSGSESPPALGRSSYVVGLDSPLVVVAVVFGSCHVLVAQPLDLKGRDFRVIFVSCLLITLEIHTRNDFFF